MPYLSDRKLRAIELEARDLSETMTQAAEIVTGGDFAALYIAAKAMADGFRVALPAELLPELDEAAGRIAAERLAAIGTSTEGAN